MTTLRSVVAPLASTVRSAGIVYIVVQVVIWYPFYTADLWRLAAPAVAVAWGATVTVRLRRGWPSPFLAGVDSAVYLTLAFTAQECVPPQVRDDMFSWLLICMSGQLLVPAWYAPGALSALLVLLSPAAYWLGARLQPVTDRKTMFGAAIILLVVALAHTFARRELYRRAAAADGALHEADQAAREQYAILSANIERREHERLLHDTVLNTLTALARAGADDAAQVVNRCRRDVALIEEALGGTDELFVGAGRTSGDLGNQVRAVVADQRGRGLTVHLDIEDEGGPALPARVTTAISNATREALSNVAAHAGTGEAWVRVRLLAPAADAEMPSRLRVFVRDTGAGFDPVLVDQGRLGLRRSIAERIADCGGQATVRSAPGQGTEVSMSWPASAHPGEPDPPSLVTADHGLTQENPSW
ncbi:MAG: ATP-binding protein [Trebonia sp.]|jgi:signal transduction histidine kinase